MNEDINEKQLMCLMLEVTYNKMQQKNVNNDMHNLYPHNWYDITDKTKIDMLSESIKNNCLIKNTELYKSLIKK